MEDVILEFRHAFEDRNGHAVAATITPIAPPHDAGRLYAVWRSSSNASVQEDLLYQLSADDQFSKEEVDAWTKVFVAYWKAVGEILTVEDALHRGQSQDAPWAKVFEAWKDLVTQLYHGYASNHFPAWTIPCLYVGGKYLRIFAVKADEQARLTEGSVTLNEGFEDDIVGSMDKSENLEEAARQLNRIFGTCINDKFANTASNDHANRKVHGLYHIANLLFQVYFKLGKLHLSKHILRSLRAGSVDLPPLNQFPKSDQVTFNYYVGVIHFMEEDYPTAEHHLSEAWHLCHKGAQKNCELILTYLIPCHLLTANELPSQTLLAMYPRIEQLFGPLVIAIKRGDLAGFDKALENGFSEFAKRRIYLTLELGRNMAIRNLLRKVFVAGGYDPLKEGQTETDRVRRTRIPMAEIYAAYRLSAGTHQDVPSLDEASGELSFVDGEIDQAEVECLVSNQIFKGLLKGYISQEHKMLVLNKKGAFPGTGV